MTATPIGSTMIIGMIIGAPAANVSAHVKAAQLPKGVRAAMPASRPTVLSRMGRHGTRQEA